MIYTYTCEKCGEVTRMVPVDERNEQTCDCGRKLERKAEYTSNIVIPLKMRAC